jgi:hypothetical protein
MNKSDFFYVHDLNLISWIGHHSQMLSDEGDHAFGTIGIRSSDGLFATQSLQSDGRRTTCSEVIHRNDWVPFAHLFQTPL